MCSELDPINLEKQRLETKPTILCKSEYSEHICFKNKNSVYYHKKGLMCKIKNVIIDKNNWKESNLLYKGPVDKSGNSGFPLLSKGFFNMKCNYTEEERDYNTMYKRYITAWNYNESFAIEHIEELSPNKTVFLFSRNQDSPNLFHGMSELLNAYVIMNLLNIKPSNIEVLFLDSIILKNDPL